MSCLMSLIPLLSSFWWCLFLGNNTVLILIPFKYCEFKTITAVDAVADLISKVYFVLYYFYVMFDFAHSIAFVLTVVSLSGG